MNHDAVSITTALVRQARTGPSPQLGPLPRALTDAGLPDAGSSGPPEAGPVDLEPLLRGRVSERVFAPAPLSPSHLVSVMAAGAHLDEQAWPDEAAAANRLAVVAVAWRVEATAPGAYVLDADGQLAPLGPVPTGDRRRATVLQEEFADAPALVLVYGNLAAALARRGDDGYRQLLVRSGAAAHAGWLMALSHGLVGCVFAGFLADAARQLSGRSDITARQLCALAVGHPAT